MKYFWTIILFSISQQLVAQEINQTHSFVIQGRVKSPLTITVDELSKFQTAPIGDLVITNHIGEARGTAKSLKGVLLKDILQTAEIDAESPKVLSEYYFICKASDNYTVVFSWNEIFNTTTGDGVYIVTEKEGKPLKQLDESILMVSVKDFRTGRRHVKSLSSIEVARAK